MIALLLLAAADPPKASPPADPPASIDGLAIGGIARQSLPAKGCAAYLFSGGQTRTLVVMASADPAALRLSLDGATNDYARATQDGPASFGFGGSTVYRGGEVTATLDMTITTRGDLTGGAVVPQATLRIDRAGKDTIILPVAGLIGCAA